VRLPDGVEDGRAALDARSEDPETGLETGRKI
jgi:hypothetical protein